MPGSTSLSRSPQCFVAANQASSRIEQVVTTEKAQLQGALAAALNERDLANTQREAAQQEVDMLRSRLREQADSAESSKEPINGLGNAEEVHAPPTPLPLTH